MRNNSNIKVSEIELKININNINYNITCNLEKTENENVTHYFKCSFIPHQYFSELKIYPKANFTNLNILNWKEEEILIKNEDICSIGIINPINYSIFNDCDSNSHTFSFEIEMESTIKKGYIINNSLILNISKPSFIDEINCTLTTKNLSSNIKLKCEINDLSQQKRITDGIFINGIRKNNIFDEYFITDNNEYININDLYGEKFKLLECPQNFEIKHCKELNKTERKCLKCFNNYYLNENKDECLTCSQLNEGCSSCNNDGSCIECLEGFIINGIKCLKTDKECKQDKYGPECKTCQEIEPNCEICSSSGFCLKCTKEYYLSGIDKDSKCIKCLSTCEECESINKCTKCNDGLLLHNGSCDSCLLYIDGCEKCSEIDKCDKCLDNSLLNYKLINNICIKENEEKTKVQAKLKFERFDNYQKEDNKIHFKTHFLLLDNILYNSKLFLSANIQKKNINYDNRIRYLRLRGLDDSIISIEKNIICDQYGNALGKYNKGGYLVNYKCSFVENEDEEYEILSLGITKMEIIDNENIIFQNFEKGKTFDVNEIEFSSLDEEYHDYTFNRMTVRNASDTILKDKLSFNIIGELDSHISGEREYEISLKDNNKEIVNSICKFNVAENNLNNQIISCSSITNKKIEYFTFESGMFFSKSNNKDLIILNIMEDVNEIYPKKKGGLKAGAIVGIVAAGLVLIAIAAFFIYKFIQKRKQVERPKKNNSKKRKSKNSDRSKDIILRKKWDD